MSDGLAALSIYLSDRQDLIIERWRAVCEADEDLHAVSRLTRAEFRNNIPAAIDELCRTLANRGADSSQDQMEEEVAKHGHHRWKQGFSLRQLIRDWGNLNRVLVGMVRDFFLEEGRDRADLGVALDRLADFITDAASKSVRRFDDLRRAEAAALTYDLESTKSAFENATIARGRLLREAAHDLRGGLSTIAGVTEVLKLGVENESLTELIEVLDEGVQTVHGMLNSLLDLSRLESGADHVELLEVNIAEVLGRLAANHQQTAEEKGLALSAHGPTELVVRTDPSKVRRIAQNLLINALKYTCEGAVEIRWERKPDRWVLSVSDTGPGVQDFLGSTLAEEMNHPDKATSPQRAGPLAYAGEGIGLTIVKRLCSLLEAGVTLESEVGVGATFAVDFPLDYPDPPNAGD